MKRKRAFILCPVRDAKSCLRKKIEKHACELEKQGYRVHYPQWDTEQDDPSGGFLICLTNALATLKADEIHIWYDESSSGSKFDMGMAFILIALFGYDKKIVIINEESAVKKDRKNKKSFLKVLQRLKRASK